MVCRGGAGPPGTQKLEKVKRLLPLPLSLMLLVVMLLLPGAPTALEACGVRIWPKLPSADPAFLGRQYWLPQRDATSNRPNQGPKIRGWEAWAQSALRRLLGREGFGRLHSGEAFWITRALYGAAEADGSHPAAA